VTSGFEMGQEGAVVAERQTDHHDSMDFIESGRVCWLPGKRLVQLEKIEGEEAPLPDNSRDP
jgi:hypothetical protein